MNIWMYIFPITDYYTWESTISRGWRACVLACSRAWRVYVLGLLTCLRAWCAFVCACVLVMMKCFIFLRTWCAFLSYLLYISILKFIYFLFTFWYHLKQYQVFTIYIFTYCINFCWTHCFCLNCCKTTFHCHVPILLFPIG